jgi:hypothetical protein
MAEKFRKQVPEKEESDPQFRGLPLTNQFTTANEREAFSNFVQSDLFVETIRAAKCKALVDFLSEPQARKDMIKWVREEVLEDDEDRVYYKLTDTDVVWGDREDLQYEREVLSNWAKGQAERGIKKLESLLFDEIEERHQRSKEKGLKLLKDRVKEIREGGRI